MDNMTALKNIRHFFVFILVLLLSACSATRFIPDGDYLLESVEVRSDDKNLNASTLQSYIRQKANSKWFSIFKIPMGTYALSGRDTTKWINRTLQKIGEEPVRYDSTQAQLSVQDLRSALRNMGYMHADVTLQTRKHGKKLKAIYTLHPGTPYYITSVDYDIKDPNIKIVLENYDASLRKRKVKGASYYGLRSGDRFSVDRLDEERQRITRILLDSGYYRFHKDYIQYTADSSRYNGDINITLHLLPYRASSDSPETLHPRYTIRKITYADAEGGNLHLRPKVLENSTALREGKPFSNSLLQKTYNNFARLQAIKYTNIKFAEVPNDTLLDCNILLSTRKPSTISFQPEGTNTAGDLGAAASLTYENRNLFRGSEHLSIELRGAFEAITGLEGYNDENYEEYSVEAKLSFPRFLAPFLSRSFKRKSTATSELAVSWDLQNRPEFHRRVFSTAWRYRWDEPNHNTSYRLDVLDLNYVYMPWISETFKHDYLDSVSNRNAILRYNYEDLFIMRWGFGLTYNNGIDAFKANIETAGNLLQGIAKASGFSKNEEGRYTLFNIAFAQYVKFDFDYTHLIHFDPHNSFALHADFGLAWPYGNSTVLPFEKRYFSGGANSVRGWSVRELGPGKFKGTDGRIDFINHTGDLKLDLNAELRTYLFWKLNGAFFIDAGNIWTLRNYADQPGGQFKLDEFYKQIAVAYGLGLRLNFDYFVLRFDMGMKAINPAYDTNEEHYAIFHPKFSRDFTFHFAVGMPF
jgi:outer membrane protein assembly factor BamA